MMMLRSNTKMMIAALCCLSAARGFHIPFSGTAVVKSTVMHSMPPGGMTPEQMKMAAAAMKDMDADTISMMLDQIESMSPAQLEEMKKAGMNPTMLKTSMRLLKSNPGVLEMAKKQMAKLTPEQMAEASEAASKQLKDLSPEQLEAMANSAQATMPFSTPPPPPAAAAPPIDVSTGGVQKGSAQDPKLIDALFATAEYCATPYTGGVDIQAFKMLPPIVALKGDLPDDLSDEEIDAAWSEAAMGSDRVDRAGFERAWLAVDELYDDDIMIEMRRPPKTD